MLLGDLHRRGRICEWVDNRLNSKRIPYLDQMRYVSYAPFKMDFSYGDEEDNQ